MKTSAYGFAMDEANIDAGIADVQMRSGKLTMNIQHLAVSILAALVKHGDKPTAARRANALVHAVGKGMRGNSLIGWFEQNAPMMYNKETKQLVFGVTAANPVKTVDKIDLAAAVKAMWHDAVPETPYKPIADIGALIKQIVAKAEKDIETMGEKSKVDVETLAKLKALTA